MPETVYALDTSVFTEAGRRYYAFDIAPVFWETLVACACDGRVVSIDHVRDELERGTDELWEWAKKHFAPWFLSTDDDGVVEQYRALTNWVAAQTRFTDAAKDEFYGAADGWLIALALDKSGTVVTQEVSSRDSKKRVKIPDVCSAFEVTCIDTFRMLRELCIRWT